MPTIEEHHRQGKEQLKKYPILLLLFVVMKVGMKILVKYTDIELPGWLGIAAFIVIAVGIIILFVLDMIRRDKVLKKMEQLEEEQSRRPVMYDSIDGMLRRNGINQSNIHKNYTPKREISPKAQAEAERLDAMNQESDTEWW